MNHIKLFEQWSVENGAFSFGFIEEDDKKLQLCLNDIETYIHRNIKSFDILSLYGDFSHIEKEVEKEKIVKNQYEYSICSKLQINEDTDKKNTI